MGSYFPSIKTHYGSVSMALDMSRVDENFKKAQQYLGAQVLTDCTPYVPKQNNVLADTAQVVDNGEAVVWNQSYARYQYYGMKMVGPAPKELTDIPLGQHTPGTVPFWFEHAKSANMDKWVSEVKKIAGGE